MTEQEIETYLATQYPVPVKSISWSSDDHSFHGVSVLDTSGVIKDHAEIHVGIVVLKDLAGDRLAFQLGHSVDGAKEMIARLLSMKGSA